MLRKYIIAFLMAMMMAITLPMAATTVDAQTRHYRHRSRTSAYYYKKPNFYRRHRKAVNVGGGAVGGMIVGGLLGGRKGAVIGGLAASTIATLFILPALFSRVQERAPKTSASLDVTDQHSTYASL